MPDLAKAVRQGSIDSAKSLGLGDILNYQNTRPKQLGYVGEHNGAANEFLRWVYSKDPKTGQRVLLTGLERRRRAEKELFEEKV